MAKVTPKILKYIPNLPNDMSEKEILPSYYVSGSNLVSTAEGI